MDCAWGTCTHWTYPGVLVSDLLSGDGPATRDEHNTIGHPEGIYGPRQRQRATEQAIQAVTTTRST